MAASEAPAWQDEWVEGRETVTPATDNHPQHEGVSMANEALMTTAYDADEFFPDDALPIHHLDEDRDGQQRGVCPHSGGSRTDGGAVPAGAREPPSITRTTDTGGAMTRRRSARGLVRSDERGYRPRRHLGLRVGGVRAGRVGALDRCRRVDPRSLCRRRQRRRRILARRVLRHLEAGRIAGCGSRGHPAHPDPRRSSVLAAEVPWWRVTSTGRTPRAPSGQASHGGRRSAGPSPHGTWRASG